MEETLQEKPSAFSTGLKYGLILGVVSIALTMVMIALGANPFKQDWKGLISIAVTIGIIVMAHKNFKENGDGYMSYGQGLGIAFIAMMVSVVLGGIFSYVYTTYIDTNLLEEVWQKTAEDMEAKGQSQEAIDMAITWTKKLFWPFYAIGGAFMALIVGLIVSIFTKKSNPETAI